MQCDIQIEMQAIDVSPFLSAVFQKKKHCSIRLFKAFNELHEVYGATNGRPQILI